MRVMAIDYGDAHTGVALSDPTGFLVGTTVTINSWRQEAVLDRLPTAEILGEQDGKYEVRAEVFGQGIEMWLRSQGSYVMLQNGENP